MLREFTVYQGRPDPCPHNCGRWARRLLPGGADDRVLVGGHKHNSNCPVVHEFRRAAALEACRDKSTPPPQEDRPESGRDTVSPATCPRCGDNFDFRGNTLCPRCQ